MALSSQIESAARTPKAEPKFSEVLSDYLMALPAGELAAEEDERAGAEGMVRSLANRHNCTGRCDQPEHARDAVDLAPVLAALGLIATRREKRCTCCKRFKDPKEFSPRLAAPDGRASWCKDCCNERARLRKEAAAATGQEKRCSRCKDTQALAEFYPDPRNSDGYSSLCKRCHQRASAVSQARRRAQTPPKPLGRPKLPRITPTEKECARCEDLKPASEFSPDSRNSDGLNSRCRDCCNEVRAERRAGKEAVNA